MQTSKISLSNLVFVNNPNSIKLSKPKPLETAINQCASQWIFSEESRQKKEAQLKNAFTNNLTKETIENLDKNFCAYYFLLRVLEATHKAVIEGDWSQFDALVKENNCQVRAIIIAIISLIINLNEFKQNYGRLRSITQEFAPIFEEAANKKESFAFTLLKKDLGPKQKKLIKLLNSAVNSQEELQCRFYNYLKSKNWNVFLAKEEYILLTAFFLKQVLKNSYAFQNESKFSSDRSDVKLLHKNIGNYLASDLPLYTPNNKYLKSLEYKFLCDLSKFSVQYLQDIACQIKNPAAIEHTQQKYVAYKNKQNDAEKSNLPPFFDDNFPKDGICSLPTFWSFYLSFTWALKNDIPVVVVLSYTEGTVQNRSLLYYKSDEQKQKYILSDDSSIDIDQAAIVIHATTESAPERIKKYDLLELILAYAAVHKQYVGKNDQKILNFDVTDWIENSPLRAPEENLLLLSRINSVWNKYICLGVELGCTINDPKLFFILHVVASTVKALRSSLNE